VKYLICYMLEGSATSKSALGSREHCFQRTLINFRFYTSELAYIREGSVDLPPFTETFPCFLKKLRYEVLQYLKLNIVCIKQKLEKIKSQF